MRYCEHCGGKLESNATFCPNCGAKISKKEKEVASGTVINENNTASNPVKDNTTTALVCSTIGFLCCTYVSIPGLILSIISLKDIKDGKISSEKKWMAIMGIILSVLGIGLLIYNLIDPSRSQEIIDKLTKQFNNEFICK